jgi:hypothetical protein
MLSGEKSCKSRITFSDAKIVQGNLVQKRRFLKVLSNPKPRHSPTYGKHGKSGDPIAGRKLYYHHETDVVWHLDLLNPHINVAVEDYAPRGVVFRFSVGIENVDRKEMLKLVAAIELKKGLAHKVGLGKSIGLGSCKVRIIEDRSTLFGAQGRYGAGGIQPPPTLSELRSEGIAFAPELVEVLRLNKPQDCASMGPIKYTEDYRNYPKGRINKKGFLGGPLNELPGSAGDDDGLSGVLRRPAGVDVQSECWPEAKIKYLPDRGALVAEFGGKSSAPRAMRKPDIDARWPGLNKLMAKGKAVMKAEVRSQGNKIDLVSLEGIPLN